MCAFDDIQKKKWNGYLCWYVQQIHMAYQWPLLHHSFVSRIVRVLIIIAIIHQHKRIEHISAICWFLFSFSLLSQIPICNRNESVCNSVVHTAFATSRYLIQVHCVYKCVYEIIIKTIAVNRHTFALYIF